MSHIDTCVRLISHEIILPAHLSRNPLDSIVKSYCKTTHIKAAITSHLFKRRMHCWAEPPRDTSSKAFHMSCKSTCCLQQPADTRDSTCPLDGSSAIFGSVAGGSTRDSCQAHTQSSNQLQVWVHHSHCLSDMQSMRPELHNCQCKQQVELLFQKIPPHSEGAKDCKELKF